MNFKMSCLYSAFYFFYFWLIKVVKVFTMHYASLLKWLLTNQPLYLITSKGNCLWVLSLVGSYICTSSSSFFEFSCLRSTGFGGEIGYVPSLNSQRDLWRGKNKIVWIASTKLQGLLNVKTLFGWIWFISLSMHLIGLAIGC